MVDRRQEASEESESAPAREPHKKQQRHQQRATSTNDKIKPAAGAAAGEFASAAAPAATAAAAASDQENRARQTGQATSDTGAGGQSRPRRPRPLRPAGGAALRRQAGLTASTSVAAAHFDPALVGMPIEAQIELASGVLQPAGRATAMPPRRPNYLPNIHPSAGRPHGFQPATSLGATALTGHAGAGKPNRYSWAQMQQWHVAQSAAAAAAAAEAAAAAAATSGAGVAPAGATLAGATGSAGRQGGFHYHFPTAFSRAAASRVLYVPNPIVNLSEHTKSRLVKIVEALKKFSEKWFSHVLLLLFLASYACLGAYIFISFEAPTEQWEKQLIIDTRLKIVNESYEAARETSSREEYVDSFRTRFEEYERLLNRVCASGMTSSSLENQWTFWGALFYSMTVFTTIGYGHLTPITFAGRVATMIYAIFGIPILLMVLADLGKLLTRIIKYAFKKFRFWYNKLLGRKASVRTRKLITDNTNQYIGVARHAFERGFATYIQPYQSRLPTRFRDSASGRPGPGPERAARRPLGEGLESSEVLITPVRQTKPVSPKILDDPTTSPLAPASSPAHEPVGEPAPACLAPSNSNKNKHSQRSQSPAASKGRKVSAHQKDKRAGSQQRHSTATSPVARPAAGHSQKRPSLDRGPAEAPPATAAAAAPADEKPRAPPGDAPDVSPQDSLALDMSAGDQAQAAGSQTGVDVSEHLDSLDGLHRELDEQLGEAGDDEDQDEEQQQQQDEGEGEEQGDEEAEDEEEDEDELDIPVSFALFLLITYMMFGAVVFSIWESWNFFDSLYFVFISMSTIGFGDLVPQHPKRMIGTFAYLLFGLALTSMCINVVQEKIHATFLRAKMQIGEKMGFDLDQIMADDYYGGESGYGDEPEEMDEMGSCCGANSSLAPSQTNSGIVDLAVAQVAPLSPLSTHQTKASVSQQGGGGVGNAEPSGALSTVPQRSKSRESLKLKKRASGGGAGGSQDQPTSSGSMKRKTSGGNKKPATAASPPGPGSPQRQARATASAAQQPLPAIGTAPLKPHFETIRMLNLPVMTQLDDAPTPRRCATANRPPEIELRGVRAFCEPLRRAFQTSSRPGRLPEATSSSSASLALAQSQGARPRLQATRSQPTSPLAKSLDVTPPSRASAAYQVNGSQADGRTATSGALPHQPRSYQYSSRSARSPRPGDKGAAARHMRDNFHGGTVSRSLGGSRRASVSHELSQLDDLIVALSHSSRPDRFGPLLGIPSAQHNKTSRSTSPGASTQLLAATGRTSNLSPGHSSSSSSAGFFLSNARRGTSMLVRPATAQPPTLGERQKKRSLAASSQDTPPFLTPSGSSSHLLADARHEQTGQAPPPLQLPSGRRKSSSASSANSRMASARQSQRELNLSESQAALDELEAVKFSAAAQ